MVTFFPTEDKAHRIDNSYNAARDKDRMCYLDVESISQHLRLNQTPIKAQDFSIIQNLNKYFVNTVVNFNVTLERVCGNE